MNNGFSFSQPILPSLNSVDKSGFEDFYELDENLLLPSFPPRSLTQIISMVDDGKLHEISIFEWLDIIENSLQWQPLTEDQVLDACRAVWTAICSDSTLGNIAFFKIGLAVDGKPSSIVEPLIETMEIARSMKGLDAVVSNKIDWLQGVFGQQYSILAQICYQTKKTQTSLIKLRGLPLARTYDSLINRELVSCLPKQLKTKDDNWLASCFQSFKTSDEKLEFLDQLIQHLGLSPYEPNCTTLVETHCLPSEGNSFWYKLSENSQKLLKNKYKLSNYHDLKKISQLLDTSEAVIALELEEQEQRQIRSRSMFWSNYNSRFNRIRALLPSQSYELIKSKLVKLPSFVSELSESDTEIYIFELDKVIAVEFLRGSLGETRFFKNNTWHAQRLFEQPISAINELRAMSQTELHDHVVGWQYFCEKLLRTKFNVLPNDSIPYFKGLPPSVNAYSETIGLPKPDRLMLKERAEQLELWVHKFWQAEMETGKYGKIGGIQSRSNLYLTKAQMAIQLGDIKGYELYIRKSANQGNPEAMWQLGKSMLLDTTSTVSIRRNGETWISKAAVQGHKDAQFTADKYRIKYEYKEERTKLVDKDEAAYCLQLLDGAREFDISQGITKAEDIIKKDYNDEISDKLFFLSEKARTAETRLKAAKLVIDTGNQNRMWQLADFYATKTKKEQLVSLGIFQVLYVKFNADITSRVKMIGLKTQFQDVKQTASVLLKKIEG